MMAQKLEKAAPADKAHIREIREVLLGNIVMGADKRMIVSRAVFGNPWGLNDGAPETIVFGVAQRTYVYHAPFREYARSRYAVEKMLGKIGKAVHLETAPEHAVCLIGSVFFRPVVLEFTERRDENGEQEMALYAYSGRTLFSLLSIRRAVAVFEKHLPDRVERSDRKNRRKGTHGKDHRQSGTKKS